MARPAPFAVLAALLLLLVGCEKRSDVQPLPTDFPLLQFHLLDGSGKRWDASDLAGEVVLLTFGFTRCTGTCPTVLRHLRETLESMPEEQQDQVRVVFVGVDYRHDRPDQVASFASVHGPRFLGLTGPPDNLNELYRRLGASARHVVDENGVAWVNHTTGVYLVDSRSKPRYLAQANADRQSIAAALRQLVTEV